MFEHIYGQDTVINLLINDIKNHSLNHSMIFHGPKHNGKLSTALELTRILNCREYGIFDCQCSNCQRVNELNFEGLIFLSRRDFYYQLKELINSYKGEKKKIFQQGIIKCVKYSLLPLQDFIIKDNFNEAEKKTIIDVSSSASEIIYKDQFTAIDLEKIEKLILEINSIYKNSNIPVDMIRNLLNWTYITNQDIKRVVIIDHVDYLEDSSRNILLKRLEEPAGNLFFILIAENRNNIMQTILSRCRSYYFPVVDEKAVKIILNENFGEQNIYQSVTDFIHRSDETSRTNIYPIVIKILNLLFLKEHSFSELNLYINQLNNKNKVLKILFYMVQLFEDELLRREADKSNQSSVDVLENISYINLKHLIELLNLKIKQIERFNLNALYQLEGIFYPIKAMVINSGI